MSIQTKQQITDQLIASAQRAKHARERISAEAQAKALAEPQVTPPGAQGSILGGLRPPQGNR